MHAGEVTGKVIGKNGAGNARYGNAEKQIAFLSLPAYNPYPQTLGRTARTRKTGLSRPPVEIPPTRLLMKGIPCIASF